MYFQNIYEFVYVNIFIIQIFSTWISKILDYGKHSNFIAISFQELFDIKINLS